MTHDCCLMPDCQGRVVWCWLTQIMTHHRASLVTDPASWQLSFLGTRQHSFHITCPCHTLPSDCMMIGSMMVIVKCLVISTDCWCSLWTAQVLLSCPDNVLETVTPVQILTSHHITDLWGAHHKQGCDWDQADRAHWTLRHVLGWAGGSGRLCTFHNMLCSPALH